MKTNLLIFCSLLFTTSLKAEPLDRLIGEVLRKNPGVAAARLNWEAMQEKPAIAGSLPDPMATYGYFFQNVETRVGAQNQRFGLSQKIPFPGKLSAQKRRASKEALMAMWQYQTAIRDAILRTKLLYCDLYRVDRSAQILREQGGLIENITRTSQQTFEAGKAELQDVLKSKVARDELRSRLLTLGQQRAGIVARLNALRGRPPTAALARVTDIPQGPLPSQTRLYAIADQYRQELQQAGVAIERDELGLALARKERLPDFTVGVDYTQVNDNIFSRPPDNGRDAVVGFVSVNVPIWFGKLNAQERMATQTTGSLPRHRRQRLAANSGRSARRLDAGGNISRSGRALSPLAHSAGGGHLQSVRGKLPRGESRLDRSARQRAFRPRGAARSRPERSRTRQSARRARTRGRRRSGRHQSNLNRKRIPCPKMKTNLSLGLIVLALFAFAACKEKPVGTRPPRRIIPNTRTKQARGSNSTSAPCIQTWFRIAPATARSAAWNSTREADRSAKAFPAARPCS